MLVVAVLAATTASLSLSFPASFGCLMALPATVSAKEKPGWRPVLRRSPGGSGREEGKDDGEVANDGGVMTGRWRWRPIDPSFDRVSETG